MPSVIRRAAPPNGHTKRRTPDGTGGRWATSPAIPLFTPCHRPPATKLIEFLGSVERSSYPINWRNVAKPLSAPRIAGPPCRGVHRNREDALIHRNRFELVDWFVSSSAESAKSQHKARVRGRHRNPHGAREVILQEGFGEGDLQRIGA